MDASLNVALQREARPAASDSLQGVSFPLFRRNLRQERDDMEPRQLVSRLLTNLEIRAMLGKIAHVFKIADRKPPHIGKVGFEIPGKAFDDLVAPCMCLLLPEDFKTYMVIEADEFGIDGKRRAQTHGTYLRLQRVEPHGIIYILVKGKRHS